MRQGCNLSPLLFNIYIEQAINDCKEYCTGVKVNGVRIEMVRFADDIVIIAQDEIDLKRTLENLDDILKSNYRMKINWRKNRRYANTQCGRYPKAVMYLLYQHSVSTGIHIYILYTYR